MDCGRIKCTSPTFRPASPVNTTVSTLNHSTSFLLFCKVITHIFRKSAQRIYLFEFKMVRRHPLLVKDKHILVFQFADVHGVYTSLLPSIVADFLCPDGILRDACISKSDNEPCRVRFRFRIYLSLQCNAHWFTPARKRSPIS